MSLADKLVYINDPICLQIIDYRNIWDITLYCQLHSAIHQLKMLNISVKTEFSYVHRITFITTVVFLKIIKIFDFLNMTNIINCCKTSFISIKKNI